MPAPSWSFDESVGRYRYPNTGRLVQPSQMRGLSERIQEMTQAEMRAHGERLARDEIDVDEWQKAMRSSAKTAHLQLYMIGKGGPDRMTKSDYGKLGASLRKEYGYLDKFARDIAAGNLSPQAIAMRSSMYGSASLLREYEAGRFGAMKAAGYTHKRRITVEGGGGVTPFSPIRETPTSFDSPLKEVKKLGGGISGATKGTLEDGTKVILKKDGGSLAESAASIEAFCFGNAKSITLPANPALAAYRIDQALGLGVTPRTLKVKDPITGDKLMGQEWIDGLETGETNSKFQKLISAAVSDPESGLLEAALLDRIMDNEDRHIGNVGFTVRPEQPEKRIADRIRVYAIDNDLPATYIRKIAVGSLEERYEDEIEKHSKPKHKDSEELLKRTAQLAQRMPDISEAEWRKLVSDDTPEGDLLASESYKRYRKFKDTGSFKEMEKP